MREGCREGGGGYDCYGKVWSPVELDQDEAGQRYSRGWDPSAVYVRLRSLDFLFSFFGATNHGGGVARLVDTFIKTKAANGACFLTYLSLLGASKAI